MIRNYFKIAFRNLVKRKSISLINIFGLAIGITCCLLIMLWVADEMSYDRFLDNSDRIYRIDWRSDNPQTRTPHPMSYTITKDFPEVENAVSLTPLFGPGLSRVTHSVRYQDKIFDEPGFYAADTTFFDVFNFALVKGNPKTALKNPLSVIITEEIASKYFGTDEPMGKTLRFENSFDLMVTGVIENIPANSHFHFDFLISYNALRYIETGNWLEWEDFGHYNYILLSKDVNSNDVHRKIPEWFLKYNDWSESSVNRFRNGEIGFNLTPITDIHLKSNIRWELEPNGNIVYVYLFSFAALFILVIACINFMNLATARSMERSREVGLRKSVGAKRSQLFYQFLGESILTSFVAVLLSIAFGEIFMSLFNGLTGKELNLAYFKNIEGLAILTGIILFAGVFSGSYPALVLSGFMPANILKNNIKSEYKSKYFRKVLVVFQFSASIILIFGTFVIYNQLHFLKTKNLGFEKEQVLVVPIKNPNIRTNYESVKSSFLRNPEIINVSAVSNVPGRNFNQNPIQWKEESTVDVSEMRVDFDYFKTMGIKIVNGRSFSKQFSTDFGNNFILNQAAAREFDWDSPLDKEITWYDDEVTRTGKVIGIAEDFHFQSLHQEITPLIFQIFPGDFNYFLIKISPVNLSETLSYLEKTYREFNPGYPFEYTFLDQEFASLYNSEEKMGKIFWIFSGLAIFIACLGLFGLAAFTAMQKTKEIGIRKVLGASVSNIVKMLSKEFIFLVTLANVIAWPTGYYIMNNWLSNFAYKTGISAWILILSGIIALIISLITVSYQAIKAAFTNPVDSLRNE